MRACWYLTVLAHLRVKGSELVDLPCSAAEGIRRHEVFIAAGAPESAGRIDYERVTNPASEDAGSVGPSIDPAGPRTFLRMGSHEGFDLSDRQGEEVRPQFRRFPERASDRLAKHGISRRRV